MGIGELTWTGGRKKNLSVNPDPSKAEMPMLTVCRGHFLEAFAGYYVLTLAPGRAGG
jgi:hypothetical protein